MWVIANIVALLGIFLPLTVTLVRSLNKRIRELADSINSLVGTVKEITGIHSTKIENLDTELDETKVRLRVLESTVADLRVEVAGKQ